MKTDELRGELTTLADDTDPFEGSLDSLRRADLLRRTARASLVCMLAVAMVAAVSVIVFERHDHIIAVAGDPPVSAENTTTTSESLNAPPGFTTIGDAAGKPVGWARSDLLTPTQMDQAEYRTFVTPDRLIPVTGPNGSLVGYVAYDYGFVPLAQAQAPGFDIVKARIARNGGCMDRIGVHDPSEYGVPACVAPKG